MIRAEIIVKGRVQKAGYRDFVDRAAFDSGLRGFVENQKDGSVKVICEGEEKEIKSFIRKVNVQKYPISVQDVEVEYRKPTSEFSTFDIKRGNSDEEMFSSLDMAAHYLREMNSDLGGKIDGLGGKIDKFSTATADHFNSLDSKYHTVSENLIKIAENNRQTSENLNKLVGLVETLVGGRSNRK